MKEFGGVSGLGFRIKPLQRLGGGGGGLLWVVASLRVLRRGKVLSGVYVGVPEL